MFPIKQRAVLKALRACAKRRNNEAKKGAINFSLCWAFRRQRLATGEDRCGLAPVPVQRPLVRFGATRYWKGQTSSRRTKLPKQRVQRDGSGSVVVCRESHSHAESKDRRVGFKASNESDKQ